MSDTTWTDPRMRGTRGERLRACRLAKGYSQADVADLCGVGVPYVSKLEADKERPSLLVLSRLSTAYGVRVSELAGVPAIDRAIDWWAWSVSRPEAERDAEAEAVVNGLMGTLISEAFQ